MCLNDVIHKYKQQILLLHALPLRYPINHLQATWTVPNLSRAVLLIRLSSDFLSFHQDVIMHSGHFNYPLKYLINHLQATQTVLHLSHAVLLIRCSSVISWFPSIFSPAAPIMIPLCLVSFDSLSNRPTGQMKDNGLTITMLWADFGDFLLSLLVPCAIALRSPSYAPYPLTTIFDAS